MKIIIDKDLQELSEILNRDETLKVECLAPKDINNKNIKSAEALFLRSITKIDNKLLENTKVKFVASLTCLLYTSPSPRDSDTSRMPSSA